jgi:para-nitrobenzyl esterase
LAAAAPQVKTTSGMVEGKDEGAVHAFLGIPYAAPPVGDLRWKPPAAVAKWTGVRKATDFGPHCMQGNVYGDMKFRDSGGSEDCLSLNVWVPAEASRAKLPVMVWIYGGGFVAGTSSEARQDGTHLAQQGVVVVSMNYRLGIFGFFVHPELAKESGRNSAGNYGLLDQLAALEWVHDNIAAFGGDPGNVTIFGESAGSFAVSTLMAAAPARGLFQKAIGESGGAFSEVLPTGTLAARETRDQNWVDSLSTNGLAGLRAMPASAVLDAENKKGAPRFTPLADGLVLTEPVPATYAAGKQAHVPLLAGWNRDEGAGEGDGMTAEKWKARAAQLVGEHADEFLTYYPADTDEQAVRSAIDYGSDAFIAFGTWKWIDAHVKTGDAPVYRYHFELAAPTSKFHPGSFAFHSDDIEYVFGTLDTRPGAVWRPEDRKLSDEMMSYWTNFARTGDPNGTGLPEWPRFDKDGNVQHLDSEITTSPDTTHARYEFLLKWLPNLRR